MQPTQWKSWGMSGGLELVRSVASADRARQVYAAEQLPGQPHVVAAIPSVSALRDYGPYRVPEGHYFMMGDNRDLRVNAECRMQNVE